MTVKYVDLIVAKFYSVDRRQQANIRKKEQHTIYKDEAIEFHAVVLRF